MTITEDQKKAILVLTVRLTQLGFDITFTEPISVGPLITTYRFAPRQATKVSQIIGLSEDLALALGVESVTIRRIPGEAVLGISVPNKIRSTPLWRDNLCIDGHVNAKRIPLMLGVDDKGKRFVEDLADLPHLLIAGSTGSGKSVLLRSLVASLCYWRKPKQIQLVVSDTKQVEFGIFDNDPHLYKPRATTVMETLQYMDDLINLGERRLKSCAHEGVHNVHEFNNLIVHQHHQYQYIVLVIDELSDFMGKTAPKEISKFAIAKLGLIVQRARAAGIYVIASTQRPSVDVVTGAIKSNFPARLSFRLPTEADSRTVLGHSGAEHLLSLGDCYYTSPLAPSYRRLHSCYASQEDITQCIKFALTNNNTNTNTNNGDTNNESNFRSRSYN